MLTITARFIKLLNEIRSEYVSAPEHDPGLERHIFRLLTLTISLLSFLVLIPSDLLQDISYLVNILLALCGGVSFAMYLAARKGKNHVNALLAVILGTLNATWFLNGGSEGGVPYYFFPVSMYPLLFYHGWKRGIILAGIIANGCILLALSYRYPWSITPYARGFDRTVDLVVGMVSCTVCIALVVRVVLITYMREQERLKVLNLKLEQEVESRMRTEDELLGSNRVLAETEKKFRTVADYTENWEFWMRPGGEFIYTSPSCERITGYDADAFYSDPGLNGRIIHPYDQELFEAHLHGPDSNNGAILTFRINHSDGSTRWIEHICRPIVDENGVYQGTRGSNRDITERKHMESVLRESEERFRTLTEKSPVGVYIIQDDLLRYVNTACAEIHGYAPEEIIDRLGPVDFIPPADKELVLDSIKRRTAGETEFSHYEFHINRKDNSIRAVEVFGSRILHQGRPAIMGTIIDVTERKQSEEKLFQVTERWKRTFDAVPDLIAIVDNDFRIVQANKAMADRLGISPAECAGQLCHSVVHETGVPPACCPHVRTLADCREHMAEMSEEGLGGHFIVSTSPIFDSAGQLMGSVHVARDITERKRVEAEIEHMAYHDALTGLPNRFLLDDRLCQTIALAGRTGRMTAVLFFDLDNFKSVNDSLGHPVGDQLLKKVVERLGQRLRKSDTIARMGGDEFIVVLSDILAPEDAAHASRLFLDTFTEPFQLEGQEIYTSASVGISLYPIDGTNTATLLKNADIAMYQAKKHGRNSFQFFTEEINRRAEERLLLENELRHAINRDEFVLHYQPWVDLASGSVGGVEALIRWIHPQHGIIPPNRFIPIAEDTGLILPIGEWVLKTACRFLEELHQRGLKRLKMSVNVSGKQMRSPNLIGLIGLLLADAVFDPSHLELELTESSVMENLDESRKYMDALKMLGVCLALDDFGTGYSSLSYLKRFPLDRLKIDRSFVQDCPDNPEDVSIARAIIALARSMNLQVTAEGVENLEQADFFSMEKCDAIQGNFIGKPVPERELLKLLQKQ